MQQALDRGLVELFQCPFSGRRSWILVPLRNSSSSSDGMAMTSQSFLAGYCRITIHTLSYTLLHHLKSYCSYRFFDEIYLDSIITNRKFLTRCHVQPKYQREPIRTISGPVTPTMQYIRLSFVLNSSAGSIGFPSEVTSLAITNSVILTVPELPEFTVIPKQPVSKIIRGSMNTHDLILSIFANIITRASWFWMQRHRVGRPLDL